MLLNYLVTTELYLYYRIIAEPSISFDPTLYDDKLDFVMTFLQPIMLNFLATDRLVLAYHGLSFSSLDATSALLGDGSLVSILVANLYYVLDSYFSFTPVGGFALPIGGFFLDYLISGLVTPLKLTFFFSVLYKSYWFALPTLILDLFSLFMLTIQSFLDYAVMGIISDAFRALFSDAVRRLLFGFNIAFTLLY